MLAPILIKSVNSENDCYADFDLYQIPVFTEKFCQHLIEEAKHFLQSNLPVVKPNTMNNYGVILDEFGFTKFFDEFRKKYLNPLCKQLYPDWVGNELDTHRAFTVTYSPETDRDLSCHFDNAEVTLNVSLNEDFDCGNIYFKGLNSEEVKAFMKPLDVKHKFTWGLLHRGRQLHGAASVTIGERSNLILWMRSSSVRNKMCPMCNELPQLLPISGYYGDGFTKDEDEIN